MRGPGPGAGGHHQGGHHPGGHPHGGHHMQPPPPPRHHYGRRRGSCLGCCMYVIGLVAILGMLLAFIF